jgi:hypothetical protein
VGERDLLARGREARGRAQADADDDGVSALSRHEAGHVRREVVDAPGPVRSRGGAVSAQIRRDDAIFVGDAGEGIDHALPALSQIVQRDQRRTLAEAVDRELDGGRERWHCAALLITTVIDLYR